MQEQTVSREIETLRPNQKEMLEIKALTKTKKYFSELINRLDKPEERISTIEDISVETAQTEMQRN